MNAHKFLFQSLGLLSVCAVVGASSSSAQSAARPKDQLAPTLVGARHTYASVAPRGHGGTASSNSPIRFTSTLPGVDTLTSFNGDFQAPGFDPLGNLQNHWLYSMVGNPPQWGGTTSFTAPVVPVSLDLLDWDGTVRVVNGQKLHYSADPFVGPTVGSPVYQNASYTSSSTPTQFTDAVQRAEFYNRMKPNWHTLLNPVVRTGRTMALPRGTYLFALNENGTCCAFVLVDIGTFVNSLFPPTVTDVSTPVGAAEHAGDITTKDISTFLFPNTFLFFNGDPNQCCVLGFHSYDFEPGDNGFTEKRYVLNYSSWISPGLFGAGFQDVTAHSHEIAETFNDPFVASDGVHNITPWWLSPNGNCQDDLEDGDVVEGLPDATFPVKIKGRTYHPQNEALLQWFEFQSPSTAIGGAYSYPNMNVLTSLSPLEQVNCQ